MAISVAAPELRAAAQPPMSYWRAVGWRLRRDPTTLVAGAILALVVLAALFAPVLADRKSVV